ncbi:MAG: DUF3656 domain-containing protein, partial [Spirochaetia bacterium]
PLFVGDRIRIQSRSGEESPSITVTKLFKDGGYVKKAHSGTVMVMDKGEAPSGGIVYKVAKSEKEEGPSPENLPLFVPKTTVNLEIEVSAGHIKARFSSKDESSEWWTESLLTEPAEKRALSTEEIENVFTATRSDEVKAGKISAVCEENLFVPAKDLKRVRREFWEWAVEKLTESSLNNDSPSGKPDTPLKKGAIKKRLEEKLEKSGNINRSVRSARSTYTVHTGTLSDAGASEAAVTCVPLSDILTLPSQEALGKEFADPEVLLPHFTDEKMLSKLEESISECYTRGIRRFRLTDLSHLFLFKKFSYGDVELTTGYPFPVTNSIAAEELREFGVHRVQAWVELEKKALQDFSNRNPLPTEIYRFGRPFLLVTRAHIAVEGIINDPRGRKFIIVKTEGVLAEGSRLAYLYPYEVLSIPDIPGSDGFYDYSSVEDIDRKVKNLDRVESTFNFNLELV